RGTGPPQLPSRPAALSARIARESRPNRRGTRVFPSMKTNHLHSPRAVRPFVLAALLSLTLMSLRAEGLFRRGDTNADAHVDVSDSIATLGYLFLGSGAPACLDAADANDDGL